MGVEKGVPVQNQSAGGFSLGGRGSAAPVACVTAATSTAHDRADSALVGLASLLPLRTPPLRAYFLVCLVALIMKNLMFTPPTRSSPQWDMLTRGPFGSGAHLALAMDAFEDSSSDTQLSLLLLPTHLDRAGDAIEDSSSDTQPWRCSCCRCTLYPDADSHCVCTRHPCERRRTRARPPAHAHQDTPAAETSNDHRPKWETPAPPPAGLCGAGLCLLVRLLYASSFNRFFLRPWAESMAMTSAAQVVNHQIFSWRENGSTRHAAGLLPLSYLR